MGSRSTRPRSQNGRFVGADRADQRRNLSVLEQDSRLWGPSPSTAPMLGPMTVMGQSCLLHSRRGSVKILHKDESMDPSWSMEVDSRFLANNLNQRRDSSHTTPIQRALRSLSIPLERLHVMKGHMMQDMCKGLSRQTHAQAKVRMLPTYICSTPNGTEKGNFLVVELCQNQVRTLLVTLYGDGNMSPQMMYKIFDMPEGITQGEGEALFDFIAQCVSQFLAETISSDTNSSDINGSELHLPLGFVFPFSCRQTQLDKAELLSWSKGFSCNGVVGKDVVQLLQSAIDKQDKQDKQEVEANETGGLWLSPWRGRKSSQSTPGPLCRVEVVALLNDTVGTMMTCSMEGRACEVAVVADKGSNCCFMAEAYLVETTDETSGRMCVNTEWGCFGDDGTLNDVFTPYDESVDEESSNPGENRFEKMVGTLYLGEIVRHALIALTAEKAIFTGTNAAVLKEKGVFTMQHVLEIINNEDSITEVRRILEVLGLQPSERDCGRVQQICRAVVGRAASLHATGLAAILSYMCQTRDLETLMVNVGVEGELFTGYPRFEEILLSVSRLLSPECMATLLPSRDGSGRGAAMVTAVALRLAAQRRVVNEVLAPLRLSRNDLEKVQALMREEMERGLCKETSATASVRMLPTYVSHTPDGTEQGDFLALDLGGTNFRVLVVCVAEEGISMASEIYVIPAAIMQGTGEELFDHIMDCIIDFQTKQNLVTQMLPLGFTFSFPCQQVGLDKALLLTWTKGFSASGCVGQDVVQLLRDAAKRKRHLGMQVVALVNDTVGTMMACGYDDPRCEIGLIVGTGTNACYMEEMRNVGTVEGDQGRMCINMEWGAFGDNGCLDHLLTHFDKVVDESTINPGKQRFEKLISGMYLGEIVRQILMVMTEKELLFQGKPCLKLQTKDIFKTKFLSTIELFSSNLQETLKDLAPNCNVSFLLSEDGSGKGAALVAAAAYRAANAME
ncbi:hexokinase-3 isoform X2 [Vidua macroura]|uniref:hexokinase-3 isoform X2 n=1 Tax=Vidua macroura TaxID=187451 RepID=UPI0023A8DB8F|nr:hexokinase-3 isoform X2 [Vidua macroura]